MVLNEHPARSRIYAGFASMSSKRSSNKRSLLPQLGGSYALSLQIAALDRIDLAGEPGRVRRIV
jgi:hypothetical protein